MTKPKKRRTSASHILSTPTCLGAQAFCTGRFRPKPDLALSPVSTYACIGSILLGTALHRPLVCRDVGSRLVALRSVTGAHLDIHPSFVLRSVALVVSGLSAPDRVGCDGLCCSHVSIKVLKRALDKPYRVLGLRGLRSPGRQRSKTLSGNAYWMGQRLDALSRV